MAGVDDIGERLIELRIRRGLTQNQIADIIGVSRKTISSYENNFREPPFDILIKLASFYRVTTDYLLGREDELVIDVSGLDNNEYGLIFDLVESMIVKNKRLDSEEE